MSKTTIKWRIERAAEFEQAVKAADVLASNAREISNRSEEERWQKEARRFRRLAARIIKTDWFQTSCRGGSRREEFYDPFHTFGF